MTDAKTAIALINDLFNAGRYDDHTEPATPRAMRTMKALFMAAVGRKPTEEETNAMLD